MKIIEKEFNALTNETTVIERDETANEKKHRQALEARLVLEAEEAQAKAKAKAAAQAKLEALGITMEDLAALGL